MVSGAPLSTTSLHPFVIDKIRRKSRLKKRLGWNRKNPSLSSKTRSASQPHAQDGAESCCVQCTETDVRHTETPSDLGGRRGTEAAPLSSRTITARATMCLRCWKTQLDPMTADSPRLRMMETLFTPWREARGEPVRAEVATEECGRLPSGCCGGRAAARANIQPG